MRAFPLILLSSRKALMAGGLGPFFFAKERKEQTEQGK